MVISEAQIVIPDNRAEDEEHYEEYEGEINLEALEGVEEEDKELFSTCQSLVRTYSKRFRRVISASEEEKERATNSPALVRSNFLTYLKTEFPYYRNWTHPTTKEVFDYRYIKETIEEYKEYSPGFYRALWALWTTQATRAFISENFNYSGSTIRRRWDKGIDTILLMLLFPELKVPQFRLFSRDY